MTPFPVSSKGKAGAGMGPPTLQHVPRQPKPLARPMPQLPPQEGYTPLRDPQVSLSRGTPPGGGTMIARGKKTKDGRHVVLDFYDLLIEPIMLIIGACDQAE